MEEISTSFCFICLLHLANEQGLKLEGVLEDVPPPVDEPMEDEPDVVKGDEKKIGNIWDIKVRLFCPLFFSSNYNELSE